MGSLFFLVIWLILLLAGRSAMLRDPGSFWHVAAGEKMLAAGQVIREDPFSFTRGRATLGGRPVAGRVRHGDRSSPGRLGRPAACGRHAVGRRLHLDWRTAAPRRLARAPHRPGADHGDAGRLAAVPRATAGGDHRFAQRDVRMAGRRRERRPTLRQLWWLVPLFILWTNVHGGVLAGLGTVGLCISGWCLAAAWRLRSGADVRSVVGQLIAPTALLLILAATTLLNPYGLALPREWLDTLTMPLPSFIVEHAPLDLAEPIGWGTLALAAVYLATLIGVFPRWPRITWLVPLVWFVLALLRVRNAPLFGVTAVIALADMLPYSRVGRWLQRRDLLAARSDQRVPLLGTVSAVRNRPRPALLVPSSGHASVGRWFCRQSSLRRRCCFRVGGVRVPVIGRGWARFDPAHWPIELLPALDEINRSSPEGTPIFNDMNFGGFLIYHAPRLRVFVDDRCSLYGTDFLLAYDPCPARGSGPDRRLAAAIRFRLRLGADRWTRRRSLRPLSVGRRRVESGETFAGGDAVPAQVGHLLGRTT